MSQGYHVYKSGASSVRVALIGRSQLHGFHAVVRVLPRTVAKVWMHLDVGAGRGGAMQRRFFFERVHIHAMIAYVNVPLCCGTPRRLGLRTYRQR
jgi:hypothetical protein